MIETQPRMVTIHEAIAGELRALMARNRVTGTALAKLLGWKQQYLSRRLTGAVPLDVNELATIAEVFDVPVEQFFAEAAEHRVAKGARSIIFWRRGARTAAA